MPAATDRLTKPDAKDGAETARGRKPLLIIALLAVVVIAAAGGGAWYWLSKEDGKPASKAPKTSEIPKPAQYFAMDPAFVVNLSGAFEGPQYLQVEVQLVTRDPEQLKAISENAPAIRARLLMLLSQVQASDITDLAGKQKLQKSALAEAQKVMTAETGSKCVDDLLFTSFVTQ